MGRLKDKITHRILSAGREFTWDEWSDYLRSVREDSSNAITTTFGKYTFNDHDICLNPDHEDFIVKKGSYGYSASIKYAECGNGLFAYGINYCTGTGGGGYGVHWADKDRGEDDWRVGYRTKEECMMAACDTLLVRLANTNGSGRLFNDLIGMIADYKKQLGRPKVVQLELF